MSIEAKSAIDRLSHDLIGRTVPLYRPHGELDHQPSGLPPLEPMGREGVILGYYFHAPNNGSGTGRYLVIRLDDGSLCAGGVESGEVVAYDPETYWAKAALADIAARYHRGERLRSSFGPEEKGARAQHQV